MMTLHEISRDPELLNQIDWEMTPEEAVTLYLEWGNNWSHDARMVKSRDEESLYFVVYSWEDGPVVHFVRRNQDGAEELAVIDLPNELASRFLQEWNGHKGLYGLTPEIAAWLKCELGVDETHH